MQVTERGEATGTSKRGGGGARFFLRGLGVILPSILTLWILVAAFRFIDGNIAAPINAGLRLCVATVAGASDAAQFRPTPEALQTEVARAERLRLDASEGAARARVIRANVAEWWEAHWYLDLAGLVLAVIAVYILGRLVGGYIGRRLLAAFESGMLSVPGIRSVYPALKQVVEFLFGSEKQKLSFNRVVMIEYPRPGIWSMGLVTGDAAREVRAAVGDSVTVFVPSSPTPFTGWTVTVPRDQVRELPITIDEALRYLVSAGVVVPGDKIGTEPSNKAVTT
ncbi:MAG: hypothetical protein RLY21_1968 [Planctomycetota bacterium]|jgi:uncharacterized membrane protein